MQNVAWEGLGQDIGKNLFSGGGVGQPWKRCLGRLLNRCPQRSSSLVDKAMRDSPGVGEACLEAGGWTM